MIFDDIVFCALYVYILVQKIEVQEGTVVQHDLSFVIRIVCELVLVNLSFQSLVCLGVC